MRKEYRKIDSSKVFFNAVIVPQVLMIICVLLFSSIFGNPENYENSLWYTIFCMAIMQIIFALIFFVYNKKNKCDFVSANKINFKFSIWQVLIAILIAVAMIFTYSPIMGLFEYAIESMGYNLLEDSLALNSVVNLIITIVCFCILPPIFEELIFRGVIFNGFRSLGNKKALLLSALCFMLIHGNLQQTFYQFAMGIVLGLLVIYSGSIVIPIITHFANNIIVTVVGYLQYTPTPTPVTYDSAWSIIEPIIWFVVGSAVIIALMYLFKKISKNPLPDDKEDTIEVDASVLDDANKIDIIRYEKELEKEKTDKLLLVSLSISVLIWLSNVIYYFVV